MSDTIIKSLLYFDGNIVTFNGTVIVFQHVVSLTNQPNFFYPHTCVIYRSSGLVNENGEEIMDGIQYGICGYDNNEGGNTTFQGIEWKTTPTLSLPDTDILFKINDHVIVNLENGRIIEASVKQIEVQLEEGMEGTTLWLTGGTDK